MTDNSLWHRVLGMVRIGTVAVVDDTSKQAQTHQIGFSQQETFDGVPAVNNYGFTSNPHSGADAVVLAGAGDQSKGVVIAINDGRYRLAELTSGEVAVYDDLGQAVYLTRSGIVVRGAGNAIRIEGDLHVTGDVLASCDSGPVSSLQHVHSGVQSGGGNTAKPVSGS
jgi:phage gp45-like